MTNLSPHFTRAQMTYSATAARKGIPNLPSDEIIDNLKRLCERMEEVYKLLGENPIQVNSGYRCTEVNRLVGGVVNSAHRFGLAIDFVCPQFGSPLDICKAIKASGIVFDQVLCEVTWVHFAIGKTDEQDDNRRQYRNYNPLTKRFDPS